MENAEYKACIDACNDCATSCEACATACLGEEDIAMLARCIKLDRDCADICRLAVAFMARGSEHATHICKECAEICRACGDECSKHTHMEHCRQCAEACYRCAEACAAMA